MTTLRRTIERFKHIQFSPNTSNSHQQYVFDRDEDIELVEAIKSFAPVVEGRGTTCEREVWYFRCEVTEAIISCQQTNGLMAVSMRDKDVFKWSHNPPQGVLHEFMEFLGYHSVRLQVIQRIEATKACCFMFDVASLTMWSHFLAAQDAHIHNAEKKLTHSAVSLSSARAFMTSYRRILDALKDDLMDKVVFFGGKARAYYGGSDMVRHVLTRLIAESFRERMSPAVRLRPDNYGGMDDAMFFHHQNFHELALILHLITTPEEDPACEVVA